MIISHVPKNKFRIGRGAIGDATKLKLSIPYALQYENGHNFDGMVEPPQRIEYNDQISRISLDTHKFLTHMLKAIIKTEPRSKIKLILWCDQIEG